MISFPRAGNQLRVSEGALGGVGGRPGRTVREAKRGRCEDRKPGNWETRIRGGFNGKMKMGANDSSENLIIFFYIICTRRV
jgi:hypothetical protein